MRVVIALEGGAIGPQGPVEEDRVVRVAGGTPAEAAGTCVQERS